MIARLTLWDTIGAFLTRSQPKAPGAAPGLSLPLCYPRVPNQAASPFAGKMVTATVLGLSALWQVPARRHTPAGRGAHLQQQQSVQMAFKWTKAARAKLSRSQKARWKERKRQQRRKRAKRSSR